ncbi:hypothetical protein U1Q18_047173 [Sarracenia purpurea var. burkii]
MATTPRGRGRSPGPGSVFVLKSKWQRRTTAAFVGFLLKLVRRRRREWCCLVLLGSPVSRCLAPLFASVRVCVPRLAMVRLCRYIDVNDALDQVFVAGDRNGKWL